MSVPIVSYSSEEEEAHSPFSRILVPIDGSDVSIDAGRVAIRMAALHSIPIIFMYVIDNTTMNQIVDLKTGESTMVQQELEEKGWRYLEYLARLAKNQGVESERIVRHGLPHSEITELAYDLDVNLIVIGLGGRSATRHAHTSNYATRVIEYAPCSVLIVKP